MINSEPSHIAHIELLAPARDLTTGIEAIRHGADAVYIGAPKFGARAAAGNSVDDIRQLVDFAHIYNVKVYVTLNTILYDPELDEAQRLMEELADAGVDALIVQDMALVSSKCKVRSAKLRLHASTQMDNRTAEKVAWLRDLGFEQVVLARELTLEEIREIHKRVPDVRLEVFVHGAICVSYNGQCYASQHCFGRSANRGECAQFCRMPFDLIEGQGAKGKGQGERILVRQKHLLSLRDMNRSDDLEALLDAGARSLKIEGRLKDVGYVKNVVAYYRQRLDEIFRRRPEYRRSSLGHETIAFTPNPAKSFNRLFTNYFLHGRTPDMANIHTPKSMGEAIGYAEVKDEGLRMKSGGIRVNNGDGLCYINKEGKLVGFRINRVEGNKIYPANSNGNPSPFTLPPSSFILHPSSFTLHPSPFPLHPSSFTLHPSPLTPHPSPFLLYRNHDQEFEQQLSRPTAVRKVDVRWLLKEVPEGFLLRLTREDGETTEQTFEYPHELARSPQTAQIERQLSRLGDTPYEATGVDIQMSQNWFIPGSVLGEWRRLLTGGKEQEVRGKRNVLAPLNTSQQDELSSYLLPPTSYLQESLSYLSNVANHQARQFYLDHGAKQVEWAMEVDPKGAGEEPLIMTCRYCIRYELGMCRRRMKNEELRMKNGGENDEGQIFLRLADGRRFRLRFDCRKCQMEVYAD